MWKRLLINGLIILSAVCVGVWVTMGPWRKFQSENVVTQKRVQEMKITEAQRLQLLQEADRAESSIGREEAVRKAHYVGPGEVAANPEKK
jgi:hypothetical protein